MKRSIFKMLFVFVCLTVSVYSRDIVIKKGDNYLKIGKCLSIYEDKSKRLTVDEVKNKKFQELKKTVFI